MTGSLKQLIFPSQEEKLGTITDEKTSIKVDKKGNFKLSQKDENENIEYFAGSDNPLVLRR